MYIFIIYIRKYSVMQSDRNSSKTEPPIYEPHVKESSDQLARH